MRHNQNGRRFRGRNGDGQRHQGNHGNHGHHHNHGNNHQGGRRLNPRMQTFDSNGPDVRIRGNAYQINEKYIALARDANSAGDRVLAESYLQHAEHYQRLINEMTEEYNRFHPQAQFQQQPITGEEPQPVIESTAMVQPQQQQQQQTAASGGESQPVDGLHDLDQGFLRGPRTSAPGSPQPDDSGPPRQRSKEPQSA
jgi:hypothetical protein